MLNCYFDDENLVVHIQPKGPLSTEDFEFLAQTVDPLIEKAGKLHGLIVEAKHFPGWEDLGAMVHHFRFVWEHQSKVGKVAIVTDSVLGTMAEHIAGLLVSAQIKHFAADQLDAAQAWVKTE